MVYVFLLSIGVICSFLLQVNGHCTTSGCKCSQEEIDDVLVTTSVMLSVGKQRNERSSTSSCEDQDGEEKVSEAQRITTPMPSFLTTTTPMNRACPSGFDFLPEADGCFKVILQKLSWSDADKACRGVKPGVHFVAITNAAKQTVIENYLKREFDKTESSACYVSLPNVGGKSVWIGGQRQDSTNCHTPFVWKTLDSIEIPFGYSNWHPGEPNCFNSNEFCVHVSAGVNYTWNDSICDYPHCPFCEF